MCVHFYVCKRSLELFSTVRICFGESKSIIINLKVKKKQLPDKTFQPTMDQPFYTHLLGDRWPAAKTVCRLSVGKFLVTDSSLIFLPYIFPKQCWMYTFTLLDRNMCSQKFLPNLVPAPWKVACSTLKSGGDCPDCNNICPLYCNGYVDPNDPLNISGVNISWCHWLLQT